MRVLVPIDGSEYSMKALEKGKEIAEKYNGEIILTNIQKRIVSRPKPMSMDYDIGKFIEDDPNILQERGQQVLEKGLEKLKGSSVKVAVCLLIGDPAEEILECAKRNEADMIVIGSLGLTGISKFLMGSVSSKVVQNAHIPVMVIKKTD